MKSLNETIQTAKERLGNPHLPRGQLRRSPARLFEIARHSSRAGRYHQWRDLDSHRKHRLPHATRRDVVEDRQANEGVHVRESLYELVAYGCLILLISDFAQRSGSPLAYIAFVALIITYTIKEMKGR